MPPKKPDPKAKGKDAKKGGAPAADVGPRKPPPVRVPTGPPPETIKVVLPEYDPRVHAPPIFMNAFHDFPGRRPQMRPTLPTMARPGGPPAGDGGGGGKKDPKKDAKGKGKEPAKKKK